MISQKISLEQFIKENADPNFYYNHSLFWPLQDQFTYENGFGASQEICNEEDMVSGPSVKLKTLQLELTFFLNKVNDDEDLQKVFDE